MKKLLVVLMAVAALTCLLAVPAFSADKLVVIDTGTTLPGFKVTDAAQVQVGDQITDARSTRAFNVIASTGGLRLWRVDNLYPPFVELINSTASAPDTILSYWDIYAGFQYGPNMFFIRDRAAGNLNRLTIGNTGNVGLNTGTAAPAYPLQVGTNGTNGNGAYVTVGGVWTDGSSRTFKENIETLSADKALETVENLTPVTYAYKLDPSEKHVGFIAEDVPDLVATQDRKHLSPMDIVAVLTKVVQEQNKTIKELSEKLNKLESQVTRIKSKDMYGSAYPSVISGD